MAKQQLLWSECWLFTALEIKRVEPLSFVRSRRQNVEHLEKFAITHLSTNKTWKSLWSHLLQYVPE